MTVRSAILGALVGLEALVGPAAVPALAQSARFVSAECTVEKIDATSITCRNDAGGAGESVRLAQNWLVVQNKAATLADIKPDDFVASAAMHGSDGKLHSTELRIFPPAMRGLGEGQRPMNDAREQTMTNATVTGSAIVEGSNDISVKFEGGQSEMIVDPGVPVTRIEVADKSLVKAGVKVRLQGQRDADGVIVSRVTLQ